jgi:galactokinase
MIVAREEGRLPEFGWNATIDSEVPVQAGCSSSSALLIAWIAGMQRLSEYMSSPLELAVEAFHAEVVYYDAPGGNMDQIACSIGHPLRVDPSEDLGYKMLPDSTFDWVLGDSNAPKDTIGILSRCKFERLDILEEYGGDWDNIDLESLSDHEAGLVRGTLRNRDIEREAAELLLQEDPCAEKLGALMSEHHSILRDVLKISTPRIEAMCEAAKSAGATGAKIFGSGGGGCMLAMVPRKNGKQDLALIEKVKSAIENVEGTIAYHVQSETGASWGEGLEEVKNPVVVLAGGASSRMKRKVDGLSDRAAQDVGSRPKAMLRVGSEGTPFLSLLIERIKSEGSNYVVVIIGEKDDVTQEYFAENPIDGVELNFTTQKIPEERVKPLGTSHAVEVALKNNSNLLDHPIVVCNGDNMPPKGSFTAIFNHNSAMLAYDSSKLGLPDDRTSAFAVVSINGSGALEKIIEKPTPEVAAQFVGEDGILRVSMNTFRLPYLDFMKIAMDCPMNETRGEKELPTAIQMYVEENPGVMQAIPFAGEFLDLTHPEDFEFVMNKLQ